MGTETCLLRERAPCAMNFPEVLLLHRHRLFGDGSMWEMNLGFY